LSPDLLRRINPRVSQDVIRLNCPNGISSGPKPEQVVHNGTDGKTAGKKKNTGSRLISITSFRKKLIDPDNLIGKYFIDSLRYAGIIHDDRAEDITYQISQRKVEEETQEKTLIRIT
jgi:hypothetical protein